uniref:Uncharacterized protein n=1 Tax=Solanum tuberosum TaxID=4113 RepID=M0ZYF4_SOLTU
MLPTTINKLLFLLPSLKGVCVQAVVTSVDSTGDALDALNTHGRCIDIILVEASLLIFKEFLISPCRTSI